MAVTSAASAAASNSRPYSLTAGQPKPSPHPAILCPQAPICLKSPRLSASEIAAIPEALKRGDFKQIGAWGHKMAGCGDGFGCPAVSEYGRELEAAALAADVTAIEQCAAKLSELVNNIEVVYC